MQPSSKKQYKNSFNSVHLPIRTSLSTNFIFTPLKQNPTSNHSKNTVFTHNRSNKLLPHNFEHQNGQEKQSNKTIPIRSAISDDGSKIEKKWKKKDLLPTKELKLKKQEGKSGKSSQTSTLRTTLNAGYFSPRIRPINFQRQTLFSPQKNITNFWKERKNEPDQNPQKMVPKRQKRTGINRFRLFKMLGQGTFSDVYLAIEKKTLTLWSIKRFKKSLLNTKELKNYFAKAIINHFKLDHPNILKLYDVFADDQYVYLLEEFMESGTLDEHILKIKKKIKINDIADKIYQIGLALKYIHDKGFIHGGLKPSSILLCHETCKLPNLQYLNPIQMSLTFMCKELSYTPPEALLGKKLSKGYDLWCLGLILYEYYVQKCLFTASTQKILMRKIINFTLDDLKFEKDVPLKVQGLIRRLMHPNSSLRMSASELVENTFILENRGEGEWNLQASSVSSKSEE